MKLTHLGHACLLVETPGARLLIDPGVLSDFAHVRDLDAVLVTHQHADHVDVARLGALLQANPGAVLVVDADTRPAVDGLAATVVVATPGDRLTFGGSTVDVLGDLHAAVYADVPGCTNAAYLVDDGALLHPGDSFVLPGREVDVLAVAIDGPWLKLAEAVEYVRAVGPRVAVPIHEGETTDPAKYAGMLAAFSPEGVVRRLVSGEATAL
ncbi:MBL fold metallo-hydrolase [Cellulomonas sp. McL0617]|uniref:MBL fold metallo-hydrolase n=1 Tax=Cellulomonas sp. McL0617 TaxID=3415675 RepID=UPI003CF54D07